MTDAGTATAGGTAVRRPRGRRVAPVVLGVWAAAIAGGAFAVAELTGDGATTPVAIDRPPATAAPAATPAPPGVHGLGDRIRMSFGVASVGGVVNVTGPAYAMGLEVRPGERVFQAQLTLLNVRREPVTYDPALVTLTPRRAVGASTIATGSATGGRIEGLSAHRFAVRFTLAAGADLPRLRLRDPAGGPASTVALGSTRGLETLDLAEHHPAPQPQTGGRGR